MMTNTFNELSAAPDAVAVYTLLDLGTPPRTAGKLWSTDQNP